MVPALTALGFPTQTGQMDPFYQKSGNQVQIGVETFLDGLAVGAAAAKAGIQNGDRLLQIGHKKIADSAGLR